MSAAGGAENGARNKSTRTRIHPDGRKNQHRGSVMMKVFLAAAAALLPLAAGATDFPSDFGTEAHALRQVHEGRNTFRFATFGDEAFWGDGIGLHLAIAGAANGGVGPGVSPATALAVGLKVDVDALPRAVQHAIAAGKVDLKSPATTLELLKLDSVVGITGFFDAQGK